MSGNPPVDSAALREEVKKKYRDVAIKPHDKYHFHTGRLLAARLGYDTSTVDAMPDEAVELIRGRGQSIFVAAASSRRTHRRPWLRCRVRLFHRSWKRGPTRTRCRYRYDGRDAGQVAQDGAGHGIEKRRVP